MKTKILFFVIIFALFSCSSRHISISEPIFLTLKTKKIKFSDTAFLTRSNDKITIDGYYAGKHILSLNIGFMVCLERGCISKEEFNARFLSHEYYNNMFLDILNKRPLRINQKPEYFEGGFLQQSKSIKYKITKDTIFFEDKTNKILIKIKNF